MQQFLFWSVTLQSNIYLVVLLTWFPHADCKRFPCRKCPPAAVCLKVGNVMAKHIFYEKLLYKKLVLNFLTNYNRNILGYCSHNSREQMKNPETFSNEAQPEFLIKIVFLTMTITQDGIFRHFHPLSGNNCPKC